ncbi:hypothetical protein [Cellulomonas wangsupingiae]|uniref:SMI1/KNR4 family protein n=1 Tax=Cellulomonas wangsupingiae TaxID=2968085 RepID=A0ABY5K5U4_9CELL|nr:hypothetical protein [Cellulomonas wangsupingiae]MCC2336386.1 hypothetical protein [Cellulomonas wangsupingiae]UUI65639.1 hypothetical protein NP075_02555 [Cellulomonas wangsupingiae]
MSGAQIVAALDGWVERLAHLGARVVDRLRPGLEPEQIRRAAAAHGFTLSEEVAAVWAWHDGERVGTDVGTSAQLPGLRPAGAFYDLGTTLETSLTYYGICGDADVLTDPHASDSEKAAVWRREWMVFDSWLLPLVLAAGPDGSTDTFRYDPQSGTEVVAHSSLPARVARWHEMLDRGAWRVEPDGTWAVQPALLPKVDRSWPVAERIRWTEIT